MVEVNAFCKLVHYTNIGWRFIMVLLLFKASRIRICFEVRYLPTFASLFSPGTVVFPRYLCGFSPLSLLVFPYKSPCHRDHPWSPHIKQHKYTITCTFITLSVLFHPPLFFFIAFSTLWPLYVFADCLSVCPLGIAICVVQGCRLVV